MAELTRRLPLAAIGRGVTEQVEANEAERARVASRIGVPAIAALSCRWEVEPLGGGRFAATGALAARLTRECVVSLEPFEASLLERFAVRFVPEGEEDGADPDAPDELGHDGTALDLGEATVEQLALSLDPYPRAPDAAPDAAADTEEARRESPFAALAARRRH